MSSATGASAARSKVRAAAIALLITAIVSIALAGFVLYRCAQISPADMENAKAGILKSNPQMKPEEVQAVFEAYLKGFEVVLAFSLLVGVVILVGALLMMNLRARGLVITSSILAMIPCVSPCCLLGLPIGIWAVVVLSQQDVKQAFRNRARPPEFEAPTEDLLDN